MNEEELNQGELSQEEIQREQQAMKDQKSAETNAKIVKTGAKAVANYYTGGVGGKVVDVVSNTKFGQELFNAGGQAISGITEKVPMGDKLQDTLNKANDSGALDMADKALDLGTGDPSSAAIGMSPTDTSMPDNLDQASSLMGDDSSSLSPDTSAVKDIMPKMNPFTKWYIYVGVGTFFFIMILIIILFPNTTLDLTDRAYASSSTTMNTNINLLSNEQIESMLIYVGDSRTEELQQYLNKDSIRYITTNNMGYYWFGETAQPELTSYISADTQKFVVLSLGLYDLVNIDQYINIYNTLISGYSNVKFYFMSVNPINELLAGQNEFYQTTEQIEEFNRKLLDAFGDSYIDTYSDIYAGYQTEDGIHYNGETYKAIHEQVISYIKKKNPITFLGEYPSLTKTKTLENISITDAIGEDGVNVLNDFINSQINIGGKCTGIGTAGAAIGLIYGLHQQGYHLPYYWGGGHNYSSNNGVDLTWGTKIGPSSQTPKGNVYLYSSLDCSGFVSWAMNTAGVNGGTTSGNFINYGKEITFEEATPGDVLDKQGHVILIIENKGDYLQTAESTTGGVQFTTKKKKQISGYKVIDMDQYYQSNCKS